MYRCITALLTLFLLAGCPDEPEPPPTDPPIDIAADVAEAEVAEPDAEALDAAEVVDDDEGPGTDDDGPDVPLGDTLTVDVIVTLDGQAVADILVVQAGEAATRNWLTDADGRVTVDLDLTVPGDVSIAAIHPEARVRGADVNVSFLQDEYTIDLVRFDTSDNEVYEFQPPGTPDFAPNTAYCGHCHKTIVADWFGSVHRQSATNPMVHDLYSGVAHSATDETACAALGGSWKLGQAPGTKDALWRCYLGDGVLPTLNPGCDAGDATCEGQPDLKAFGACADCHAPAINGKLGGRNLLDATGWGYDSGVQCETCHKVESLDEGAEAGIAGWLKLVRPTEEPTSPTLGVWAPLTFGPSVDSLNIRMGTVQRDHFHEAALCGGCHEQHQPVLVPGATIDTGRWPSGRLPIHTTFSEWKAGPMNPAAPCQSCHMPPNPKVTNGADQQIFNEAPIGWVAGFIRPVGSINHHTWDGPRAVDSGMLQLAAMVFVKKQVDNGVLTASVRTRNVGPGHAIPTGEPMRSLVLTVTASCGDTAQLPIGGHVVPDFGGYVTRKTSGQDWFTWAKAEVGDQIRVVMQTGIFIDYDGYGPFGDGSFDAAAKGMPTELFVASRTVTGVTDGVVELDVPLPEGDVAYLVRKDAMAGAPGFGFARVLVGSDGQRMVPHYRAVDVASDNRLLPQSDFETTHEFAVDCEAPVVTATLLHRAYPYDLAHKRGIVTKDTEMVKVVR